MAVAPAITARLNNAGTSGVVRVNALYQLVGSLAHQTATNRRYTVAPAGRPAKLAGCMERIPISGLYFEL